MTTQRLLITHDVLNKLGFTEYWDEHGTWGGRTLAFSNGILFRIIEQCQMDDNTEGYEMNGRYVPNYYYFEGSFAIPKIEGYSELFFLHEMYQCLEDYYPSCLPEFIEKCKAVKMKVYIDNFVQSPYRSTKIKTAE